MAIFGRGVSPGVRRFPVWGLLLLAVLPLAIHWRLVLAGSVDQRHLCCDFAAHHYPAYLEGREWFRTGVFPQWNPYGDLGGAYFLSDPEVGLFYPPNWVVYAIGAVFNSNDIFLRAIYLFLVAHVGFGGVATALLARTWAGLRWPYALLAGTLYVGSGFIHAHLAGHAHTVAFSLTPATLLVWLRFLETSRPLWFAATAALLGSALLGGYHFVPLYVTFPTMLALTILRDCPLRRNIRAALRHGTLLAAAVSLAFALFSVQLLPFVLAYQESYRASAASLEWSGEYRIDFSLFYQMIIPNLYTGIGRGYGLTYYLGLLPLLALGVALLRPGLRNSAIVHSGVIACVGFVVALGHQTLIHQLVYFLLPGVGIFRSISFSLLLVVIFGAIAVGALLQALADDPHERSVLVQPLRKFLVVWVIIATVIFLLLSTLHALVRGIGPQVYEMIRALELARPMAEPRITWETGKDILRVINGIAWAWGLLGFAFTATVGTFLLFLERPNRTCLALIALVFVIDASAQVARHPSLTSEVLPHGLGQNPARLYEPNKLTARLSTLRGRDLVRSFVDNTLPSYYYSANHHLFTQIAESQIPPPYRSELLSVMTSPAGLDAFNFRFLVTRNPTLTPAAPWRFLETVSLSAPAPAGAVRIYENPHAMPRAFLVERVSTVPGSNPTAQLAALRTVDPRTHAVVFARDVPGDLQPAVSQRSPLSRGRVAIDHYERGTVRMTVEADGPGFVFMSDAYHPWWKLSVDGRGARLARTNVHFRGFFVPPGRHVVEMRFDTFPFWIGAAVSAASMLTVIVIASLPCRGTDA